MAKKTKHKAAENSVSLKKKNSGFLQVISTKPFLFLGILALFAFFNSLKFGFVYLDDDKIIIDNQEIISKPAAIFESFTSAYGFGVVNSSIQTSNVKGGSPYYRPVVNLSFVLNALMAGKEPLVYHVTNFVFHLIAVFYLFLVLENLSRNRLLAFLLAGVFCVHPVFTNAVVWIVGRNDLLAGMFSIASFYYFLQYLRIQNTRLLILHGILLSLAIFSKELAVFFPFVLLVYLRIIHQDKFFFGKYKFLFLVWVIPVVLFAIFRYAVLETVNVSYGVIPFLHNLRVLPELFSKGILPLIYSPLPTFTVWHTIFGFCVLIALIALPLVLPNYVKVKYYFGLIWFAMLVLPGLFILYADQGDKFDYLDCRVYLPAMGLYIGLALALTEKSILFVERKLEVLLIVVLPLLILTNINAMHYKNGENFAQASMNYSPENSFSYRKAADYYFEKEDFPKAIIYLNKAIEKSPNNIVLRKNLALSYSASHDYSAALKQLVEIKRIAPNDVEAHIGFIKIYFMQGRYLECYHSIRSMWALGINPKSLYALYEDLMLQLKKEYPVEAAELAIKMR